jgi:hypothetical protein
LPASVKQYNHRYIHLIENLVVNQMDLSGVKATEPKATSTGERGFVFEELIDQTLRRLIAPMAAKGLDARLLNEQQIRDEFSEQSLNGVDHYFEIQISGKPPILFLIQEKWKQVTNQREVSQFLDCCARILSRMEFKGRVVRIWATRTPPTLNGEKSLQEGGSYVIQSSTSMVFLAQEVGQFICEVLGDRSLCVDMIAAMPSMMPGVEPAEATAVVQQKVLANASAGAKLKICVVRRA